MSANLVNTLVQEFHAVQDRLRERDRAEEARLNQLTEENIRDLSRITDLLTQLSEQGIPIQYEVRHTHDRAGSAWEKVVVSILKIQSKDFRAPTLQRWEYRPHRSKEGLYREDTKNATLVRWEEIENHELPQVIHHIATRTYSSPQS